ncbi:MAG: glycosyltransferase family 4 protein [Anaerolineae bacterium]|nr:glycosyltransferase family 4 protein [Gloeobacterales cyanobacterium ES-bin-313]
MGKKFASAPTTPKVSGSANSLFKRKILISSYRFHPNVGGIETVALILAEELTKQGYIIKVITQALADQNHRTDFPFEVIRRPSPLQTLHLVHWCDLYLINNSNSLRATWPLLAIDKPAIIVHHGQHVPSKGLLFWQEPLKNRVLYRIQNISVSYALAKQIDTSCTVISNPYQDELFVEKPEVQRKHELVFLGRLDHQKGLDLLLKALNLLREQALAPRLTIVGNGIEKKNLQRMTQDLGLTSQVRFVGEKTGQELVSLLNAHHIMVVPSRPFEAFGIVALEGIACGCVVLGSAQGGLPEAIGPCGETFISEDVQDLAKQLSFLLQDSEHLDMYRANAKEHLSHFHRNQVVSSYVAVVERVLNSVVLHKKEGAFLEKITGV